MSLNQTLKAQDWLDEHGDVMFGFALRRLGCREAAQDAVQDALLAALQAEFRGESTERTWLIGILRYKVLDECRRRARRSDWKDEIRAVVEDDAWACACGGRPTRERTPQERAELRRSLRKALESLPDPMRLAFVLREIDGVRTPEICEILDVTPTNLWTILHRAKHRLRRVLSETE